MFLSVIVLLRVRYLEISLEGGAVLSTKILLVIISGWLTGLLLFTSPREKHSAGFLMLITITMLIIISSFVVRSLLSFYIFFEISILPVVLLILGWGYQPERIRARFFMFFYTLFGSLPLLLIILSLENQLGVVITWARVVNISLNSSREFLFFALAFLIKLPIYFSHLWLPKAHVEAPVRGSMILAGLILKLGGLGLVFLNILVWKASIVKLLLVTAPIGGIMLGLTITRLTDIKVIIAYSSVVHIRLVFICSILASSQGLVGLILVILCHGLTSPGIFSCANIMYERRHSRRALINKGKMSTHPAISIFWFLLIMSNFGGPFTINLIREIFLINSSSSIPAGVIVFIAGICFFSALYNILLYATLHQGVKFFRLRGVNTSVREILLLSSTTLPGLIIILRFQIL